MKTRAWLLWTVMLLVLGVSGCGTPAAPSPTEVRQETPATVSLTAAPAETPVVTPTAVPADSTGESSVLDVTWVETFGEPETHDMGHDALPTGDDGYFVVGVAGREYSPENRGDVYLVRTDSAGQLLWEATYGGEQFDEGDSAALTSDGGLVIVGQTSSFDAEGVDAYLLRVDQEGSELWSSVFGGPKDEMASLVAPAADGGYWIAGNLVDPEDPIVDPHTTAGYGGYSHRSSVWVARVDDEGHELWSQTYDDGLNVLVRSGMATPDGGFLVLATIHYLPESNDADIYLLKVDGNGEHVWSRTWEEGRATGHALIETTDGDYVISGLYAAPEDVDSLQLDLLFLKVDSEGGEIWNTVVEDPDAVQASAVVAEAAGGGYVALGSRVSDLAGGDYLGSVAVMVDRDGNLVWERPVEIPGFLGTRRLLARPDGGYVIAGYTVRNDAFDVLLARMD